MLQTIVGNKDIAFGMYGKQGAPRGGTVAADEHRNTAAPSQQQRLVADDGGVSLRIHPQHRAPIARITAADDPGEKPGRTQLRRQPEHERRLAAAADGEVADDDHRHRQTLCGFEPDAIAEPPQGAEGGKQPGKGKQEKQRWCKAALEPQSRQTLHQLIAGRAHRRTISAAPASRTKCAGNLRPVRPA